MDGDGRAARRSVVSTGGPGAWLWRQPYVLLALTTMFWGGNITIARAVAGHVPPVALAQIRWSVAFLLVLPFAWSHLARDWPVIRRSWPILALLGLVGVAIYNTFTYVGLTETTAINAALLQSFTPMVIAVAAFAIYRDRLTVLQAVGIAVSFAGVLTILSRGSWEVLARFTPNPGDLWVLAAILAYGTYTALLKSRPAIHPVSLLAVTMGIGQAVILPATVAEAWSGARLVADLATVLACLYVAVFPSLVAYALFNRGVELIGANRAAPFFHLVPVFGSLFAVLFLGEAVAWFHAAGWVLIVGGIAVAQQRLRVPARPPGSGR